MSYPPTRRSIYLLLLLMFSTLLTLSPAAAQVLPGIDVLVADDFAPVAGKRVGLVLNQTSVRADPRQTTLDAFLKTKRCKVTALYSPEHGIDGAALAGEGVVSGRDSRYNLPVHSLYGSTKKPTRQMLADVDVIVYDIQDIGVRSYTFISTMIRVMEGCAEAGVPVVILDRPNPIGGSVVDGPVLDPKFSSFVGVVPIPYVYGLTAGELALMANEQGWLAGGRKCDLTVIRMQGWRRSMTWRDTRLQWIPTSPHVPTPEAAFANAITGAIGEIGIVSIGIGYTLPFELVGATWMEPREFADRMNAQNVRGLYFRPASYKPFYGMSAGKVCGGAQLIRVGEIAAPFTATVALLVTLRDAYPEQKLLSGVPDEKWAMFDKVCGTDAIRKSLLAGRSLDAIVGAWRDRLHDYIAVREGYLLYE